MSKETNIQDSYLTGENAERFVEEFAQKSFLLPWVFKNPKFEDGDELSDVSILFKDTLILIEVKGNKFDPKNPQRYLKSAKKRHGQLKKAERIVKGQEKIANFQNGYFSFKTNFKNIKNVYLISVSTGPGEMEIASGKETIDYAKINYHEVAQYLGFYDEKSQIHSFTANEIMYASEHLDTIKDFLWYLDFEKKYLGNEFTQKKEGQNILAIVDDRREDMIAIYILTYYWDEELNKKGKINIDKIFGNADVEKADMILYAGADTRKSLTDDSTYKEIEEEKKISYFWDRLVNYTLKNYEYAHKITSESNSKTDMSEEDLKEVLEVMSDTSRFERVEYSRRIKETDEKNLNFRNIFSCAEDEDTLFSYSRFDYDKFPSKEEQQSRGEQHLYTVWCRIKYGENLKLIRDKIKKALLITRHQYNGQSALSFCLSSGVLVDEKVCKKLEII